MESLSSLQLVCTQVFEAVAKTTSIFILPFFMMRIIFANLVGEGSRVFETLKGIIIYFCLVAGFPLIIELLFEIPEAYLPKYESFSLITKDSPNWATANIIPSAVDHILEVILAGLYWIVYYLHVFFMIVMCSMAPIVFLTSTLLGLGLGLEIFMGLLIVGSSWPIIWFGFDQVHLFLASAQTDHFGGKCLELLLTLLKGIAPVAFAGAAIKSPPGQAIAKATGASIAGGRWVMARAMGSPQKNYSGNQNNSQNSNYSQDRNFNSKKTTSNQASSQVSDRLKKAQKQYKEGVAKNENSRPRDSKT